MLKDSEGFYVVECHDENDSLVFCKGITRFHLATTIYRFLTEGREFNEAVAALNCFLKRSDVELQVLQGVTKMFVNEIFK